MSTWKLVISFLILFCYTDSFARWATKEEAQVVIDYQEDMSINKEFCATHKIKEKILILNEAGRVSYATRKFNYNASGSNFTLIKAVVINDKTEKIISNKYTEDKPLASNSKGFSEIRQFTINFPDVKINSIIEFEYIKEEKVSGIPNVFDYSASLRSEYELINSLDITIDSEVPLCYYANDPRGSIEFKTSLNDNYKSLQQDQKLNWFTSAKLKLKKPVINTLVDEYRCGFLDDKDSLYFVMSSCASWLDFKNILAPYYNAVLEEKIPLMFEDIIIKAKTAKTEEEKLHIVLDAIQDKLLYMGNWLSTQKGRTLPHSLAEIATLKFIDCKGFASVTGAILRKLGFDAYVAIVRSSNSGLDSTYSAVPYCGFNHAILYVKSKTTNKEYWLDPTMQIVTTQICNHIAGKRALILINTEQKEDNSNKDNSNAAQQINASIVKQEASSNTAIELQEKQLNNNEINNSADSLIKIPEIQPENNRIIENCNIEIKNDDLIISREYLFEKLYAMQFTNAENYSSKKMIEEYIFNTATLAQKKDLISIEIPSLKSRILKDILIKLKYLDKNAMKLSNVGKGLEFSLSNNLVAPKDNSVSNLVLGAPHDIVKIYRIKNIHFENPERLDFKMDTEYFLIDRKIEQDQADTIITIRNVLKKRIMLNAYLRSAEFYDIFLKYKKYSNAVYIIKE